MLAAGALLLAALLLAPGTARADGAFPNALAILVPADRPDEIVLGTNFGLVGSEDGGRTWTWSCEQAITSFGRLYQMAPAPTHRLYAIARGKLVYSDDGACGWQTAGGALGGDLCEDAFVDPSDAARVLAAGMATGGGVLYEVYQSTDGGATFDQVVYHAEPGDLVTGIEIAASDSMTIDVALAHGATGAPTLARTTDGGGTWTLTDLTAAVGAGQARIVAIDPTDADRVFLRVIGAAGDTLAVATDGGATVTAPLTFDGGLTAFVRTSTGTLLAFGTDGGAPALYRSRDGGAAFAAVAGPPAILALAERAGTVYAATDTMLGPVAEATSTDEGTTWTPGLTFAQVAAIDPCVKSACQTDCAMRAQQQQWPATVCAAAPPPPVTGPSDAGLVDAGALPDAAAAGLLADAAMPPLRVDAGDVPRLGAGCRCAAAPSGSGGALPSLLALAALVMVAGRRPASWSARRR